MKFTRAWNIWKHLNMAWSNKPELYLMFRVFIRGKKGAKLRQPNEKHYSKNFGNEAENVPGQKSFHGKKSSKSDNSSYQVILHSFEVRKVLTELHEIQQQNRKNFCFVILQIAKYLIF